jgi:alpha-mannosidase
VLRLSLLRAPGSPNPPADVGKPLTDEGHHEFSYALFPHKGDWKVADLLRRAYEYNHPLIPLRGKAPDSASSGSYMKVDPSNVILSALKKAEDDDSLIVRVYEAEGSDVRDASVELPWKIVSVDPCDLIERPVAGDTARPKATAEGNVIHFPLGHHEIATFRVRVR